jgi:uncharacterized SAM-binding protein YcdF (DUF218 family)
MSWVVTNLISAFLLPPLPLLLIAAGGLFIFRRHPRLARALLAFPIALLWIVSTPYFAGSAMQYLEDGIKPVYAKTMPAEAIVVLGGGTYINAPEYGNMDTVSEAALARVRYAAKLQRETGKPILATGGRPLGNALPEAQQMKSLLENEFNVPVKWTEDESRNTEENAKFSYALLQKEGIRRIYLVTHAWHMPRAAAAFKAAGFDIVPAPIGFATHYEMSVLDFIPSAAGLEESRIVAHELIGRLWYRLKS